MVKKRRSSEIFDTAKILGDPLQISKEGEEKASSLVEFSDEEELEDAPPPYVEADFYTQSSMENMKDQPIDY